MLHVLHLHHDGLLSRRHPHAHGSQHALDPARHDRLLLAVLRALQQLLGQVAVHRRVGAAAAGAGERDGLRALAVAAHQELRARPDERGLGRAGQVAVAGGEGRTERVVHGARLGRTRHVHAHLPR